MCRQRTTVYFSAGDPVVFSEQRLLRIFSYARSKQWTCSEHDGASVVVTGVIPREGNPLQLTIHFLCKRSRILRKPLAHSFALTTDLLALEAEMTASAPREER